MGYKGPITFYRIEKSFFVPENGRREVGAYAQNLRNLYGKFAKNKPKIYKRLFEVVDIHKNFLQTENKPI